MEVQRIKAASKIEVFFVSDNLEPFKEPKCMGTDDIISHLSFTHSYKTKADLWVPTGSSLTTTFLPKKCLSMSFSGNWVFWFGCKIRIAAVLGEDKASGVNRIKRHDS